MLRLVRSGLVVMTGYVRLGLFRPGHFRLCLVISSSDVLVRVTSF
jgi:hypothetical protein